MGLLSHKERNISKYFLVTNQDGKETNKNLIFQFLLKKILALISQAVLHKEYYGFGAGTTGNHYCDMPNGNQRLSYSLSRCSLLVVHSGLPTSRVLRVAKHASPSQAHRR